jgi:hypothetical protein
VSPAPDDRGRNVVQFSTRLRNAGRLGAYADEIVAMYESDDWREYITAVGREQWLECEFDYFLIACQMQRDDVARVLAWNADSAKLAPLMDRDAPPDHRRPLETAAASWTTPGGEALVGRAKRLGWLADSGRLAESPVPRRARTRAATGLTMDERARLARADRIPAGRRKELDALAQSIAEQVVDDLERRYILDRLTSRREK